MKQRGIPETDSIRELAEFWDTHDVTDFNGELEEVNELGRVALLLPRGVDLGAGLMLGHVLDELHDGRLDLVHGAWIHLVVGGLIDGHECPPLLVCAAGG